jgi:trehalose-phosphatase
MSQLADKTCLSPADAGLDRGEVVPRPLTCRDHPAEGEGMASEGSRPAPESWSRHWPGIQRQIVDRPRLLLALGFDGILSPTVPRPGDATMPEDTQVLLAKFASTSRVTLAFLSGRSLGDIQARVGLPDAYYVGNHGMEVRGPGLASSDGLAVSCRSDLVDALAFLVRCTKKLPGVFVEDKGMTVNVHWRLAQPDDAAAVRELMEIFIRNHPRLRIFAGEACWELRARSSWNKGDALRQILMHLRLTPADTIYLGEEFTDDDAFAHLSEGLSFCVGGAAATAARYRLPDTTEARQLLFCILCAVNGIKLK